MEVQDSDTMNTIQSTPNDALQRVIWTYLYPAFTPAKSGRKRPSSNLFAGFDTLNPVKSPKRVPAEIVYNLKS
jgi:hypothetical protein